MVGQLGVGGRDQEAGCYFRRIGHILFAEAGDQGEVVLLKELLVLSLSQLLETGDCLVPDGRLVERGEYSERVDEGRDLCCGAAIPLEFEDALCYFGKEVVVVVHLLDDLDEVGDELVLHSGVT